MQSSPETSNHSSATRRKVGCGPGPEPDPQHGGRDPASHGPLTARHQPGQRGHQQEQGAHLEHAALEGQAVAVAEGAEEQHAGDGYPPTELPTCWAVDSAPDTEPAVAGSAWPSTVVVSGVMHSPCPAPSSTRPGKSQATVPPWAVAR